MDEVYALASGRLNSSLRFSVSAENQSNQSKVWMSRMLAWALQHMPFAPIADKSRPLGLTVERDENLFPLFHGYVVDVSLHDKERGFGAVDIKDRAVPDVWGPDLSGVDFPLRFARFSVRSFFTEAFETLRHLAREREREFLCLSDVVTWQVRRDVCLLPGQRSIRCCRPRRIRGAGRGARECDRRPRCQCNARP